MARPINTLTANGVSNGNRTAEETEAGSAYRLSDPSVIRPPAGGIFDQPFRIFTFVSETNDEIHHADNDSFGGHLAGCFLTACRSAKVGRQS